MQEKRRLYSDSDVSIILRKYRRTGDPKLREEIVEKMRPLVQSVARKFSGREPYEDLESEGLYGLLRAVDQFQPERGTRFSTYATHVIGGQIRHYLRDRGHLIRQPAWLQELNWRVERAGAELEQQLRRAPTAAELGAATNLSEESVDALCAARRAAQVVRWDFPADREEDDYLLVDAEK